MSDFDKYQTLHRKLFRLTKEGALQWRQVERSLNAELLLNAASVIRQFETTWAHLGHRYVLRLVEKRKTIIEHPLLGLEEIAVFELLILENGELIEKLDASSLSEFEMLWLATAIKHRSESSAPLFEAAN